MVRMPVRTSAPSAFGPTPQRERTGSGARKAASPPAGTTPRPSGFPVSEAILATVLLVPTPIDMVSPVSSFTRRLISRASASGPPWAGACTVGSRNAPSRGSGSTHRGRLAPDRARLVGRGGAAPARPRWPADDDRLPPQRRVIQLLHRGVEGVQV